MTESTKAELILQHPLKEELLQDVPADANDFQLKHWDRGVFSLELLSLAITPPTVAITDGGVSDEVHVPEGQVKEGTYRGTQLALTEIYHRIEKSYATYFDVLGIEPTLPRDILLEERREMYQWSNTDEYPPHLDSIPAKDDFAQWQIFNRLGLVQTGILIQKIVPEDELHAEIAERLWGKAVWLSGIRGQPYAGDTIAEIENNNKSDRKTEPIFAQQQFTGANPVTITLASNEWLAKFVHAAKVQKNQKVVGLLGSSHQRSFYIQDSSYFRDAIDVDAEQVMSADPPRGKNRWACATVSLFQLHPDGRLHPIAIVVDYKGSIDNSVTIFNKRLHLSDSTKSEKEDWPWRYAKTCAQVTDWLRHEITVHLVNAHFIEEVIIVATNRNMDNKHPIFRLLEPHWLKTLSVNAGARSSLVPNVVLDLIGFKKDETLKFVNHAFHNFDFVGGYVPKDLAHRGFPVHELEKEKFKNYAYARNMILMWKVLRKFVADMLALDYPSDASVAADGQIKSWYQEIQTTGKLPTFPTITTRDELIDAVTMCIHVASSQHTAVNYLQNFYMSFVIAKPPALCSAPPTKLSDLEAYNEKDLVAALPVNRKREWLLAVQLPWLLSFRVAEENNILNYAISVWRLHKHKASGKEQKIKEISQKLYQDLRALIGIFAGQSCQMTEGTIPYIVLDPNATAVSILI